MNIDMTKGKPAKIILSFFIPLFLGDLLQQFYGIIDALVIGKYVGVDAFAAVGASGALTLFITSILLGLSLGASSLYSKLYGAKDYEGLKKSLSTSLIFLTIVSLVITIISSICLPVIIDNFKLPIEIQKHAYDYLQYVFYGFFFVGIYNAFSFVLRAFGDSKTPLYLLIISCLLNLVLDIYFVKELSMQTKGAAIATLLTQALSAILCGIVMIKKLSFLEFKRSEIKFYKDSFKEIGLYSILTAFQQSISSFGMMLVQGFVNTFGQATIAAFAAASKVDAVANAPLQDLANSFSTYTSQNLGANQKKRIKEGFKVTLIIILLLSLIISSISFLFAKDLITLFVGSEALEVILIGERYLKTISFFYFFLGLVVMFYAFFRGMQEMKISIALTIISQGIRVVLAYFLSSFYGFSGISYAIILGWIISDLIGFIMYRKIMRK